MPIEIKNNGTNIEFLKQQHEIELYQKEYNLLREEIQRLIVENRQLSTAERALGKAVDTDVNPEPELDTNEPIDTNFIQYKRCTDNAIQNLHDQIASLNEENSAYKQMWSVGQKTVEQLEQEIAQYLQQAKDPNLIPKLKTEFENSIKMMRNENEQLKNGQEALQQSKLKCEQQLTILDKKHNDLIAEHKQVMEQLSTAEQQMRPLRIQITSLKSERDEFEKQYRLLNEQHSQCRLRETLHLTKVQESVHLAETAIKERDEAVEREKEIREECDRLATTIGRVMEEAGDRVDSNIEEMKREYEDRIRKMEILLKKVTVANELQRKNGEAARKQLTMLQERLELSLKANETLDRELQLASRTVVELELKIEAYEKMLKREQETSKDTEERSKQLQKFIESNKRLKQRWKDTFDEMTQHLQNQLKSIHKENAILLIENQQLRVALGSFDAKKS